MLMFCLFFFYQRSSMVMINDNTKHCCFAKCKKKLQYDMVGCIMTYGWLFPINYRYFVKFIKTYDRVNLSNNRNKCDDCVQKQKVQSEVRIKHAMRERERKRHGNHFERVCLFFFHLPFVIAWRIAGANLF